MPEPHAGRASASATAAFAARRPALAAAGAYRELGGLAVSSLGLGTYLGPDDDATDRRYQDAIVRAIERGVNVLDTAINYRSQRSERTIGRALGEAVSRGLCRREEILVASKAGFLPFDGHRPPDPARWFEETWKKPGLVRVEELVAGCHCLAPRYLEDQIARSRRNLGLETIDVYYLHNPETQLEAVDRAELARRLRAAFEVLERACADGAVGCYGTATWNGYRVGPGEPEHLELTDLWALAREVGGDGHRFRVVQLPYNAAMPEAFVLPTQRGRRGVVPLLEAAAEAGISVMTSASIAQGRRARSLQLVRSTPGVTSALVGMSRVAHVDENTNLLGVPPLGAEAVRALLRGG